MESSRSDGATGSGLSENLLPEGKASDRTPLMTLRSTSSQENDTRPMTYLEGVGYVPSGPRSSRSSLSVQITREVRIASLPVVPKVEETVENVSFVNTENTQWYTSVSPLTEEPPPTFTDNYIQDFRMALATHNQDKSTGSQRRSSRRQDINGHRTREGSRQSTMSRFRSRSPTRLRVGSDARYYSSSPLFFPYEHEPRDRDGESITRTLSMGRTPRPARAEHVDDEDEKICTCPVSYDCRHRSATKLDCRSLVREYMPWRERRDQEAFDRHRMSEPLGERNVTFDTLEKICAEIERFEQAATNQIRQRAVTAMRDWILEVVDSNIQEGESREYVTSQVLPRLRQFLSPENNGIRRSLPIYIEEELTVLQRKWERGDFDGAVDRGLTVVQTQDVNGVRMRRQMQVNPEWPHHVSALYFGAGNLVNGQVWYSRVELQRDGVHAPRIAGISGTSEHGARSVVLGVYDEKNHVGYADIDMGEVIEYMGTALPDEEELGPANEEDPHMHIPGSWNEEESRKPTPGTRALMKSLETGKAVRVVRSYRMCGIVKNKPRKGYRYDGLYKVTRKTAMKEARQIWSFRLERLPNQGRLRGFATHEPQPDSVGVRKCHFWRSSRNQA